MNICIVGNVYVPAEHHEAVLADLRARCAPVLGVGNTLAFRAPERGPTVEARYLEDFRNPYFQHLAEQALLETLRAADLERFDALIVNCFDDPAVVAARPALQTPLFGLSAATFAYAAQLGHRIGAIVPEMPGQAAYVMRQIESFGLSSRLVDAVRTEGVPFRDSFAEALEQPATLLSRLRERACALVDAGAEVVVIACGGLGMFCERAGFHVLEHRGYRVPVVLPLVTAVRTVDMLLGMARGLGHPLPARTHEHAPLNAATVVRYRESFGLD